VVGTTQTRNPCSGVFAQHRADHHRNGAARVQGAHADEKEHLDLENAVVWIPDSKTPNRVAEVPLTPIAAEAFRDQLRLSPCSPYLFPSDENPSGHQRTLKTVWSATLRRAKIPHFRIYDPRSTYATRLSAGVADEWVTLLLRQGDAKVFKKYSQMKLQMKREALVKLNRMANEQNVNQDLSCDTARGELMGFDTVLTQFATQTDPHPHRLNRTHPKRRASRSHTNGPSNKNH